MFLPDGTQYFCHADIRYWTHGLDTPVLARQAKGTLSVGLPHFHDFYELTVVMDGHGDYTYQGCTYHLEPGDAFITPPSVLHHYTNQRNLELVNFIWYPEEMPLPFSSLGNLPGFRLFFDLEPQSRSYFRFEQRLVLSAECLTEVRLVYLHMSQELQSHQEGYQLRLACLFYGLLIQLCRWQTKCQNSMEDSTLLRMERVVSYMEKHFGEHLTRPDMARLFAQGDRSFAEKSKQVMRDTFGGPLMKIRLRHARELLLSTDKSLTEIAQECGFCDSNYLCLVFRKKYGLPPHQYRLQRRS